MEIEDSNCLPCCTLCCAFVGLCTGCAWGRIRGRMLLKEPSLQHFTRGQRVIARAMVTGQMGLLFALTNGVGGYMYYKFLHFMRTQPPLEEVWVKASVSSAGAITLLTALQRYNIDRFDLWRAQQGLKSNTELVLGVKPELVSPFQAFTNDSLPRTFIRMAILTQLLYLLGSLLAYAGLHRDRYYIAAHHFKGQDWHSRLYFNILNTAVDAGDHFAGVCLPKAYRKRLDEVVEKYSESWFLGFLGNDKKDGPSAEG